MLDGIADGALGERRRVRLHFDVRRLVETNEVNAVRLLHGRTGILLRVLALVDLIEWQPLHDVEAVRGLDELRPDLTGLQRRNAVRERGHHRALLIDTEAAAASLRARIAAVL